ncbi:hypothetical protein [Corynebacterium silvaticum]|uniref:Uncharacterized protein n=1 Tax=Corynebacterium silvaticum TaxID=2320431 RepID=A0ACD4Q0M5_9CORY|nr:hypothetical protein [Corynebacterium silvaticum]MBH5299896.1 hypothetical protein [Corynebacterium silvaticum]NOM65885.1 hypothetical protein [Corynebacterium silvaticum]NON71198.1 hypothetical protein [Corynebacterium silvaticum]TFA91330.1 hypothetical protein EU802_11850 [Corynebacterium silvaticum]TFA91992.1 hypothetical protein EU799_11845 [Corynebacterium silvaticum]
MNHDDNQHQTPGTSHGDRQHHGPEGQEHLPTSPKTPTPTSPTYQPQQPIPPSFSADELRDNPILLAQVTAYLQENHLHLPLLTPDLDEMTRMKQDTPELYRAYVKAINKQVDADYKARTLPYTEPSSIAKRGQRFGLIAIIAVLTFCAFLAFRGHAISATLIAAFDLIALASVFASNKGPSEDK